MFKQILSSFEGFVFILFLSPFKAIPLEYYDICSKFLASVFPTLIIFPLGQCDISERIFLYP